MPNGAATAAAGENPEGSWICPDAACGNVNWSVQFSGTQYPRLYYPLPQQLLLTGAGWETIRISLMYLFTDVIIEDETVRVL